MERVRRFAWILALFGVLLLVAWGALLFLASQDVGMPEWTPWVGISGGLLVLLWALLDRESIGGAASSRAARYGAGAVTMVVLFGAIVGFAYMLARDHDQRWDLTRERRFSLSDQTIQVLSGVEQPVRIYAFFRSGSAEEAKFRDLMDGFTTGSPSIEVEYADPLRNPMLAEQFTITSEYGTVVMVSGESRQRLEADFSEEAVTNALVRLLAGEEHRICWSIGHGEAEPDDDHDAAGLGAIVLKMEDLNYTVTKSRVLTEGIDRACEALVVARPQTDWLPSEREALAAYLAEGGRVLMLLEPGMAPELAAELERYGVLVADDLVVETSPAHRLPEFDPSVFLVYGPDLTPHPITRGLSGTLVFASARSVRAAEAPSGVSVQELAHGSPQSWGETRLDMTDPAAAAVQPDEGEDIVGSVPIVAVVEVEDPEALEVARPEAAPDAPEEGAEAPAPASPGATVDLEGRTRGVPADFAPKPGGRMVVIGDSEFASNQLILFPGNNQDLFLNSVAWLVGEESQLGSRADETEGQGLGMSVLEVVLLGLVAILFVPGLAVGAAVGVMLRRRFL